MGERRASAHQRAYPNPGTPFVLAPGVSQTILFQGKNPNGLALPRGGNGAPGSNFDQLAIDPSHRYLFTATERNGNSAVIRFDQTTGAAATISQLSNGRRFDMVHFTPWGTVVAAGVTSVRTTSATLALFAKKASSTRSSIPLAP